MPPDVSDRRWPDLAGSGGDCALEQPVVPGHAGRPRHRPGRPRRSRACFATRSSRCCFRLAPSSSSGRCSSRSMRIWQRPRRVAAARLNAQAVGERLVWDALSLVAQARTAHADAVIADRRLQLADRERRPGRSGWPTSPRRGLRAGDISDLEARAARSDAARVQVVRRAAEHDRDLARLTLAGPARPRTAGRTGAPDRRARPSIRPACGPRGGAARGRARVAAGRAGRGDRHRSRGRTGALGAVAGPDAHRHPRRQRTRARRRRVRAWRQRRPAGLLAEPGRHPPRRRRRSSGPAVTTRPCGRRSRPTCGRARQGAARPSRRSPPGATRSCRRSRSNSGRRRAPTRPARFRCSPCSTSAAAWSRAACGCSTPRPTFSGPRSRSSGASAARAASAEDRHACTFRVRRPRALADGRLLPIGLRLAPRRRRRPPSTIRGREAELTTVRLTPEAVKRLGIETVAVKTDVAPATRSLGGEIVVPEGRGVVVTAPVAGTLTGSAGPRAGCPRAPGRSPDDDRAAGVGRARPAHRGAAGGDRRRSRGARGAPAAPAARATAQGRRGERAQRRRSAGAASGHASRRSPPRASGCPALAEPGRCRRASWSSRRRSTASSRRISAVPGQTVAASAPLLQIAQVDTLWVRVRGLRRRCRTDRRHATGGRSRKLGGDGRAHGLRRRVTAPLRGDPSPRPWISTTRLPELEPTLRPGERVLVELPLKASRAGAGRAGRRGAVRHPRRHVGLRGPRRQRLRAPPRRGRPPRRATAWSSAAASLRAPRSSPPARPSCSAPSSARGTEHALAGRALAPQPHRRRRARRAAGRDGGADAAHDAARRVSRVRAAARRSADRSARAVDQRSRSAGHRAAGSGAQRHPGPATGSARNRCSACRRSC